MLGGIAGDVIGSVYEGSGAKVYDFPLFAPGSTFTDDTVLSVAVAHAILEGTPYEAELVRFGLRYPDAGYGASFRVWLRGPERRPYRSWGNGSAMRVGPVGYAFDTEEAVRREAAASARVTHDHPEGVKGAQATALAILLARQGRTKDAIRAAIAARFGYDLERTVAAIRPGYAFDVSCQGSVPESIVCFLDSHDFESAVRNAVSLGGDADTMACIAGSIAAAFYGGVPAPVAAEVIARLPPDLRAVVERFHRRHGLPALGDPP